MITQGRCSVYIYENLSQDLFKIVVKRDLRSIDGFPMEVHSDSATAHLRALDLLDQAANMD